MFTDIEGSTELLRKLGDRYGDVLSEQRRILRETFSEHGGREVDNQGDALFFSFERARDAVAGAVAGQRELASHEWPDGNAVKVRMGLHTGEPAVGDEGYVGLDVVRAARICSAGHGGQILLSETTRALLGNALPAGATMLDLGQQNLKDIQHERIFQLSLDEQPVEERPLKTGGETQSSFEQRISNSVERHIENVMKQVEVAMESPKPPKRRRRWWKRS